MKSSHYWSRMVSWFVLTMLAAWAIGKWFDFSLIAIATSLVLGIVTVHLAFPEIWEWLKND